MKTRVITNAEIRKILGLGSGQDALTDLWNDAATEIVCDWLGMYEIATHVVTEERAKVHCNYQLFLRDFPVDLTVAPTLKTTFDRTSISGYTFRKDPNEKFTIRSYATDGNIPLALPYDEVLITYTAGWRVQDLITVLSNTDLVGKTITVTVNGTSTTYTFVASGATALQIDVGATVALTAANIATKFGTSAVGAAVTMPLGYRMALGTATTAQLTIVNPDLPMALKNVIALVAGGGIAEKSKAGAVSSYTIGGKSVTFRSDSEASAVEIAINSFIPHLKRTSVHSI